MALIELNKVCKTYYIGGKIPVYALKDVDLKIEQGEFVAIMGASGSGKSTLLAILGLLDRPECGKFLLSGKDISSITEKESAKLRNRFFGFIFQSFNLLPRLDIVTNACLPFVYAGKVGKAEKDKVIGLMTKIGLGDRLGHKPNELSGGQQQRVAVARALVNDPLVILADEPTGNLDSKSANEIIGLLKDINAQGNTIIMVSHEPSLAREAGRIITLSDGKIVSDEKTGQGVKGRAVTVHEEVKNGRSIFSFSRIANYVNEAFLSLLANKLRSFLSILGVVVGVAAVIAMLAVGQGAQKQVETSLSALGTNLLMVRAQGRQAGISLGADTVTRLTVDDVDAVKKLDHVKGVVPYVQGRVQAVYGSRNWNTQALGTSTDYVSVRDSVPSAGRFFTNAEIHMRAKVAVIGVAVAKELFQEEDPLGKWIKANRINFQVIGILPEKGMAGFQNSDDRIVIPYTTAMHRLLGRDYINNFDVQIDAAENLTPVSDEIIPLLVKLHRLPADQSEQFEVRNMADIQKAASETIKTFSFLLGAIAAVSLLVGGIGIMNIMLVLVMERTHEIGLRKALGAEDSDIMTQFLVESVMICLLGGFIGITIGVLIAVTISFIAGWNVLVSQSSILLASAFSIFVGVVFGLWPARRASRLLPVEALRYE